MKQKRSVVAGLFACIVFWGKGGIPGNLQLKANEKFYPVSEMKSHENGLERVFQKAKIIEGDSLGGTFWRLVEFQSMNDEIGVLRPHDPSLYTMRLNSDSSVTMHLNCNYARGSWSAKTDSFGVSGNFQFSLLSTTKALCPSPSMDEIIIAHSEYVRSYLLKNGNLYLSLMADGGIFVWEPYTDQTQSTDVPAAPEDGGPRNWVVTGISNRLNLREKPSTNSRIITSYKLGTLLDNLGCVTSEGQVWCDVQELGGGPRGYVSYGFLEPAVSPDGSIAKGPDDSALRAGQNKFDATGKIPCSWFPGQPMALCEFGVARAGGGYATVVIKKPDNHTRAIFFRMGKPIGADISEADGGIQFHATKENDLNIIHIGNEHYEIPDAVIFGD